MTRVNSLLVQHEIEMPSRRRVDFEDLEHLVAEIGEGMFHAGGDIHDVVLADTVIRAVDGERPLAAFDDIDVVGTGVVMQFAARATRDKAIEMHIDLLGAEARIDELDLLAPASLHRASRTLLQAQNFEHALFPPMSLPRGRPACNIADGNRPFPTLQACKVTS